MKKKKPKTKSALDLLPPSKLDLEEWKRMYSNNDTRSVAMPWFWEHFDPQGYSIYLCDYNYNSELKKVFMTCNLLGGFVQRLDKVRKYAFSSLVIFGQEEDMEISGVFVFRGGEVPAEMKECDDYEHYTWKRIDIGDASQKALVEDFFAWDGSFGGRQRKFNQGKIFK